MIETDNEEKIFLAIDDYKRHNYIEPKDSILQVFLDNGKEYTINDVESYFFIPKFGTRLNNSIFRKSVNADISNFYIGIKAINKEHACRFFIQQTSQVYLKNFYITKKRPEKLLPLVLVKNPYEYTIYDEYCEPFPELFEY